MWQNVKILAFGLFFLLVGMANIKWPAARWVREVGPLPTSPLGIKLRIGLHLFMGVLFALCGVCYMLVGAGVIFR